jgi:hypothetical protein
MSARFKRTDLARAIRAAKDGGLENFDVVLDGNGRPIVRVRAANGTPADLLDELEAWDREQKNHAA